MKLVCFFPVNLPYVSLILGPGQENFPPPRHMLTHIIERNLNLNKVVSLSLLIYTGIHSKLQNGVRPKSWALWMPSPVCSSEAPALFLKPGLMSGGLQPFWAQDTPTHCVWSFLICKVAMGPSLAGGEEAPKTGSGTSVL